MNESQTKPTPPDWWTDTIDCWHRLPNKAFFFALLAVWLLLFQFWATPFWVIPYVIAVRLALLMSITLAATTRNRQQLRQPHPVSGCRAFLVEAQGTARAAVETLVAGTVMLAAARRCTLSVFLSTAACFHRRAVCGDLRVDGAGVGARMAAAQHVSVFSFYVFHSADSAPEFYYVSAAATGRWLVEMVAHIVASASSGRARNCWIRRAITAMTSRRRAAA